MNRRSTDIPERLLETDATDFERRMLEAARRNRPSAAASARMAMALGVSASAAAVAAAHAASATAAKEVAADVAGAKVTAAARATAAWPWVSAGLLALVVAGAVIGARAWRASRPEATAPSRSSPAPLADSPPAPRPPVVVGAPDEAVPIVETAPGPGNADHRSRTGVRPGDIRDEIALLDAARGALAAGADLRAREILRRYRYRHPTGGFLPEATAIDIEALMKLGRDTEARARATRFVAEHRGSLLARRVAELVGLTEPPTPAP